MTAARTRSADEILNDVVALLNQYVQTGGTGNESHVGAQEAACDDEQCLGAELAQSPAEQLAGAPSVKDTPHSLTGHSGLPWEDVTGLTPKGLNLPMSPAFEIAP